MVSVDSFVTEPALTNSSTRPVFPVVYPFASRRQQASVSQTRVVSRPITSVKPVTFRFPFDVYETPIADRLSAHEVVRCYM